MARVVAEQVFDPPMSDEDYAAFAHASIHASRFAMGCGEEATCRATSVG